MKSLILCLSLLLTPFVAKADLNYQMNNIRGNWDNGHVVFKVYKQSESTVRILRCDRTDFLNNNHCSYDAVFIFEYRSNLDAFMSNDENYIPNSLQVSLETSSDMVQIENPYSTGGTRSYVSYLFRKL